MPGFLGWGWGDRGKLPGRTTSSNFEKALSPVFEPGVTIIGEIDVDDLGYLGWVIEKLRHHLIKA